jgi:hypothetical protein
VVSFQGLQRRGRESISSALTITRHGECGSLLLLTVLVGTLLMAWSNCLVDGAHLPVTPSDSEPNLLVIVPRDDSTQTGASGDGNWCTTHTPSNTTSRTAVKATIACTSSPCSCQSGHVKHTGTSSIGRPCYSCLPPSPRDRRGGHKGAVDESGRKSHPHCDA